MIAHLRALWTAPAASPPPPRRVWRDYLVVGAGLGAVLLEALLRPAAPWPMLFVIAALLPTLLWRRTRPLLMIAIAMTVSAAALLAVGGGEPPFASAFFIVLLYALARWGSGRSVLLGVALVLVHLLVTELMAGVVVGDVLGALVVVITIMSVGLAMRFRANAKSRELERARSVERERLARDVHDTVAHHVSAIAIRAQAGLATAASDPAAATNALQVIESEASSSLTELRAMLRVLRADDSGHAPTGYRASDLERLARNDHDGPRVDVRLSGDLDAVAPEVLTAVFRIAQESVTNARRHATGAALVSVAVEALDNEVRLEVRDDGAANVTATAGFGITGMRERAALLGGDLTAAPSTDHGWTVRAVLPRERRSR